MATGPARLKPAPRAALTVGVGQLTVRDTGAVLTAGAGCVPQTANRATCATASAATVDLGDGDDTLAVSGALPVTVTDGAGADAIAGGSAADVFVAGDGADACTGGGGLDTIDYSDRATPVISDSDGHADDGAAGETD